MTKPLTQLRKAPAQKRAGVTFDAFLDAAAHILRENGPRALTTNKIAARAGASIGSLYQYFPNKQSIVRALIEREIQRIEADRPSILDDQDAPPAAVMRAAIDWHFDSHRLDSRLARELVDLAKALLPVEEQLRLAAVRRERVGRTMARLMTGAPAPRQVRTAFVVDVCIQSIAAQTQRQHPDWLASPEFRSEVSSMLEACLRPQEIDMKAPSPA